MVTAQGNQPDSVVVTYGTNDSKFVDLDVSTIVAAYAETKSRVLNEINPNALVLTALTPPSFREFFYQTKVAVFLSRQLVKLNEALLQEFPGREIVDFYNNTYFPEDFISIDGIHLNDIGQAKRAQAVFLKMQP